MSRRILSILLLLACFATAQPNGGNAPVDPSGKLIFPPPPRPFPNVQAQMREVELKVLLKLYETAFMEHVHAELYSSPGPETDQELVEKKQKVLKLSEKLSAIAENLEREGQKREAQKHAEH